MSRKTTAMSLSEPSFEIQIERNVPVPMRDGTRLLADVYRPKIEGQYPVIVERTQGWRSEGGYHQCQVTGKFFAPRGYAYVAQNMRGTFGSEGQFYFGRNDAWDLVRDGYDTVEWAARQPWSNGRVGMAGTCGSGMPQYQVAPTRPPHLKALFVIIPGADKNYYYRSNVYRLSLQRGMAFWFQLMYLQHETAPPGMEAVRARLEKTNANPEEIEGWFRHLPLRSFPPADTMGEWYWRGLEHPEDGPYWWGTDVSLKFGEVDLPITHVGGWFDLALAVALSHFSGIQGKGRTADCRRAQRLIVGPWGHLNVGQRQIGELDFGPEAVFDIDATRLKWCDYWLKESKNDALEEPPVKLFLMGDNRWIEMETWPPPDVRYEPIYLRAGDGASAESLNNGWLTFEKPGMAESPDSLEYDPENPISSLASSLDFLPVDCRVVEGRMLTYTSNRLDNPLTIVGPVRATLYGLSSAPDTDWVVRLCDVWPDGRSMSVCDGILRARYRNSSERQELMVPNQVYRFEVDLWATAQTFLPGHRIRIQVTSSDFPRYDRNLNTGGAWGEDVRGQVAVNTVFHDTLRPSHIVLPVMP